MSELCNGICLIPLTGNTLWRGPMTIILTVTAVRSSWQHYSFISNVESCDVQYRRHVWLHLLLYKADLPVCYSSFCNGSSSVCEAWCNRSPLTMCKHLMVCAGKVHHSQWCVGLWSDSVGDADLLQRAALLPALWWAGDRKHRRVLQRPETPGRC